MATAHRVSYIEPGARHVGECPGDGCYGMLMLVEDRGPGTPMLAQCDRCLTETGVAHGSTPRESPPDITSGVFEAGF